ncbi:MAG: silent information regulator protein Sir2 [Bacteroides sp.]|nr:silent information regulator protein Sir2 [Bacteroides sp.]
MKKKFFYLLATGCIVASLAYAQDPRERCYYYEILEPSHEEKPQVEGHAQERVAEKLGRALTAALAQDGQSVYLSWRMLQSDAASTVFHVYREAKGKVRRLTSKALSKTCDFIDKAPQAEAVYWVEAVARKGSKAASEKISVSLDNLKGYTSIRIRNGEKPGKLGIADLNGDGLYDYILRTPSSNVDPGSRIGDKTGKTYQISAYLNDGTYLWTHDMGQGIEPGVWYSPYVAYDFNGDGKAEVAMKATGPDAVRDENGHVGSGSEYLIVLDGMTGKEIDRVEWPQRNYRYGNLNRQNRNQIGVAYLDGKTPYILAARGTYKLMVVDAWMLKEGKLQQAWHWDGDEENPVVRSMGAHNMVAGDVDNDGRDEILLGSCMLDDNGTLLWSSGLGHSDKAYLCKLKPDAEGLQVFMVSEPKKEDGRGVSVVDAATGKLVWGIGQTTYHVGDGMVTDFDPAHPGLECFASEDRKGGSTDKYLLTADGTRLNVAQADIPNCRNWVWWDADLLRETLKGDDVRWGAGSASNTRKQSVVKWKGEQCTSGIEGDILLLGDMDGDWREEIVTSLPGEVRVYRTNIPARDRRVTLMQDPLYRSYITHRSMGYPQAPVPSYYLGE